MDPKTLPPINQIEACQNMLDKLADAQGRAKCGYIYIINELLEDLKGQITMMEDTTNQNGTKTE